MLDTTSLLPETFLRWFAARGWTPRAHQLELLAKARAGRCVLLIAPTGAGKTLAGFLPSLVELSERGGKERREKGGRGGRTVTVAGPLVLARPEAEALLAAWKKMCGSGGTLKEAEAPDGSPAFVVEELGGQQEQHGTDALAAASAEVLANFRYGGDVGNSVAAKLALDGGEIVS